MADDAEFLVQFNHTLCISLPRADATVARIKKQIQSCEGVPADLLDLYANGRKLLEDAPVPCLPVMVRARLSGGLRGGKGGFGAMLRSSGKGAGAKATTNFGACRDLNGRRLRHVNQEIAVQKWREDGEAREQRKKLGVTDQEIMDEETPSGIPGWYLAMPSWAEGVKKSYMKRRRNTIMCKSWLQARENGRTAPPNAPRWWGCPRGRDCDFAHGEEELRGAGLTEYKKSKKEEVYQRKQQELQKYVDYEQDIPDDIGDAIRQGMRKRNAKSKMQAKQAILEEARVLPPDAMFVAVRSSDAASEFWLVPTGGSVGTTFKNGLCELRGQSNFGTATVFGSCITSGKWYYEVRLITDGVIQIGWADGTFAANSETGDGVGDHVRSWAYDGNRQVKWTNGQESEYGMPWEKNDVIGCMLDLDEGTISFSKNGEAMEAAFDGIKCLDTDNLKQKGFFPAISVEQTEILLVNIGAQPFLCQQEGYQPVFDAIRSDSTEAPQNETHKVVDTPTAPTVVPEPEEPVQEEAAYEPLDLDQFGTAEQLEKLGLEALKLELQHRKLKCGGSLAERAKRLLSVRGKTWEEIDGKLKDVKAKRN
ncbi:hypothetical protein FI667_g11101, partial [Globisporangium splendens]